MCFFVEASRWLTGIQLPKQTKQNKFKFWIPQRQVLITSKEEYLQSWYKAITDYRILPPPYFYSKYKSASQNRFLSTLRAVQREGIWFFSFWSRDYTLEQENNNKEIRRRKWLWISFTVTARTRILLSSIDFQFIFLLPQFPYFQIPEYAWDFGHAHYLITF